MLLQCFVALALCGAGEALAQGAGAAVASVASAASVSSTSPAEPTSSAVSAASAPPAAQPAAPALPVTPAPSAGPAPAPAPSPLPPAAVKSPVPSESNVANDAGGVDPVRAFQLRTIFQKDVTRRLNVPAAAQHVYGQRLQAALAAVKLGELSSEYVVLVDRNPNVQALFIYYRVAPSDSWQMIGASPVATGRPGQYDHFITPLGVFAHSPDNMDFRAEGTMNENGIRGYGARDMRIFDFGWTDAERGWGKGGESQMRFQMHATDPDKLEPLLGIRHSKGCVRIPASLNVFLDHYGILDAEYEGLVDAGQPLWVLHSDRQITPWAGRYLVVIDSGSRVRPAWSPLPNSGARRKMPPASDTAD